MKIKVEQFIRTKHGLDKIIKIDDEVDDTCGLIHLTDNTFYNFYTEDEKVFFEDEIDYKVANTPMELLQDGDLIKYRMYVGSDRVVTKSIPLAVCGNMKNEVMIYAASMLIPHDWITDILTPNLNGGYDLQYSKEERK